MYLLSNAYRDGSGVAKDSARAWTWLLDAAGEGHALAAARVGIAYAEGGGAVAADPAAALKWLTEALRQAAREAVFVPEAADTYRGRQLALARYHLGMLLLPTDQPRGVALLREAADRGCSLAQYHLARLYRQGEGMPRDDAAAERLYTAAANQGVGAAAFELADGYADGWAGARSAAIALRWYRRAAALGYADAWMALGRAYEEARGVGFDPDEALTWYQLAGNNGVAAAQIRLGDIARLGQLGQPVDVPVAMRWYKLAAGQGDAAAEERIGDLYWQGAAGLARDRARAVRHYRVAAGQGIASAERKLAVAYANGDGAPADDAQMLYWDRKAAEAGDAQAAAMLGYAIMIGVDGSYDLVEAATWLTLAADHGHDGAWRMRAMASAREVVQRLTPVERAAFRARIGHWQAAMAGD